MRSRKEIMKEINAHPGPAVSFSPMEYRKRKTADAQLELLFDIRDSILAFRELVRDIEKNRSKRKTR